MWRKAYESGQIKSPVFTDVKEVLEVISKSIPIYIYSSGSVEAQQLLFKYSEHGDMTKFIAGYFDTNIGHKVESESYCRIAESIKVPPQNILFLTDIEKEAEAAQSAGVPTMIVKRDGNAPLSPDAEQRFAMTSSFKVLLS
ncbi:hypothetical protein AB6A40_006973 [Gnathostoma spinigerum]|uniref:Enolase-phosphatase E1 n=1 Tax=Gnathostoma spinigerum TaxID=75299 RepID=A0ABD6EJX1_9BILA